MVLTSSIYDGHPSWSWLACLWCLSLEDSSQEPWLSDPLPQNVQAQWPSTCYDVTNCLFWLLEPATASSCRFTLKILPHSPSHGNLRVDSDCSLANSFHKFNSLLFRLILWSFSRSLELHNTFISLTYVDIYFYKNSLNFQGHIFCYKNNFCLNI